MAALKTFSKAADDWVVLPVGANFSDLAGVVAILQGGTGENTAQEAIDALTAVSGATIGHVLTKSSGGNAEYEAPAGGGGGDLVDDLSPQLGGDLDSNTNNINMKAQDKVQFTNTNVFIHATGSGAGKIFCSVSLLLDCQLITIQGADKLLFRDSAIHISSTTDGQLDIVADTKITLTAPTITLATLEAKLRRHTKIFYIEDLSSSDDFPLFYTDDAITIEKVVFKTDAGTITFNLEFRGQLTPASGSGTQLWTADEVADSTGEANTTFDDATVPAESWVTYQASAHSSTQLLYLAVVYRID